MIHWVPEVVHWVPGVLGVIHRVLGVIRRVLGVIHRVLGVTRRVLMVKHRVPGVLWMKKRGQPIKVPTGRTATVAIGEWGGPGSRGSRVEALGFGCL